MEGSYYIEYQMREGGKEEGKKEGEGKEGGGREGEEKEGGGRKGEGKEGGGREGVVGRTYCIQPKNDNIIVVVDNLHPMSATVLTVA